MAGRKKQRWAGPSPEELADLFRAFSAEGMPEEFALFLMADWSAQLLADINGYGEAVEMLRANPVYRAMGERLDRAVTAMIRPPQKL